MSRGVKSVITTGDIPHRCYRLFSAVLILVGSAIIIIALLADRLGFGDPGGLGTGKLLLALAGLFLVLAGLLGKRAANLYRATAIILLNTLVLLGALELGAIVLFRSGILPAYRGIMQGYPELPYYAAQDWTHAYWQEAKLSERYQYQPYIVWRHRPFQGDTIHINQEGIRITPGADCGRDAYTVFTLGGSTMLGWGSPDWGTIPAYLQAGLESLVGRSVCVLNLAEDGFVSTQSLVALIRELQSGNVPDMVLFYDGVNEVIAAYESGEPDVHVTLAKIASRFEEPENSLLEWIQRSRIYSLIATLAGRWAHQGQESGLSMFRFQPAHADRSYLADAVAEVYLGNYRIVDALAQEYGFEYSFFVQPHLAVTEKVLTKEEQHLKSRADPALTNLAKAVYASIASAVPEHEHLQVIAGILDEERTQIWIDQWGHITPEGNRIVAQEILARIQKQLPEK